MKHRKGALSCAVSPHQRIETIWRHIAKRTRQEASATLGRHPDDSPSCTGTAGGVSSDGLLPEGASAGVGPTNKRRKPEERMLHFQRSQALRQLQTLAPDPGRPHSLVPRSCPSAPRKALHMASERLSGPGTLGRGPTGAPFAQPSHRLPASHTLHGFRISSRVPYPHRSNLASHICLHRLIPESRLEFRGSGGRSPKCILHALRFELPLMPGPIFLQLQLEANALHQSYPTPRGTHTPHLCLSVYHHSLCHTCRSTAFSVALQRIPHLQCVATVTFPRSPTMLSMTCTLLCQCHGCTINIRL